MRSIVLSLALLIPIGGIAVADEKPEPSQFLVTVLEYHLPEMVSATASERDILALIGERDIAPVQTLRLTALESTRSMVQFGKRVSVQVGEVTNRNVTSRQTKPIDIGTILRVEIAARSQGPIIEVSYSSSYLDGEGTAGSSQDAESPQDVVTVSAESAHRFEIGQPRLIASTTLGESSFLFVTVSNAR